MLILNKLLAFISLVLKYYGILFLFNLSQELICLTLVTWLWCRDTSEDSDN
jgi:hypothetical protein